MDEGLHDPCSKNKGADQLCSYCTADLRLCFCLCMMLVFLSKMSSTKDTKQMDKVIGRWLFGLRLDLFWFRLLTPGLQGTGFTTREWGLPGLWIFEPPRGKNNLHVRKQRCRSASR